MELKEPIPTENKIKLTRGMKGTYGWEITLMSHDINILEVLDNQMIKKFDVAEYHKEEAAVGSL